jgi:hypothetical protein
MWYKDRLTEDCNSCDLKFIPSTIQLHSRMHLEWKKESLLRVLREIDILATLRYEAYSRSRENGSSPFVRRKSRRDLTSHGEWIRYRVHTGARRAALSHTYAHTMACADAERKRRDIKKKEARKTTLPSDGRTHFRPGEQKGKRDPSRFRVKVNEAGKQVGSFHRKPISRKVPFSCSVRSRTRAHARTPARTSVQNQGRQFRIRAFYSAISVNHQEHSFTRRLS